MGANGEVSLPFKVFFSKEGERGILWILRKRKCRVLFYQYLLLPVAAEVVSLRPVMQTILKSKLHLLIYLLLLIYLN